MKFSISGLYLITPDRQDTEQLVREVQLALAGGVNLVQYRNKLASADLRLTQASALLKLCRAANVPLLINDHLALASRIDADGVHLGQTDGLIAHARSTLGADKIIGASCYQQFELAQQAQDDGASYVAFGACYPSLTKPHAPRAAPALFTQATQQLKLPLVAIGGICLENAQPLLAAGANALAVITDIFQAHDIRARCQQYQLLFQTTP